MMSTCVYVLLLAFTLSAPCFCNDQRMTLPDGGTIWAVLVAGSNGYFNYRHQADVSHAYQILHKNGIPDENIIVMMYDDVARSNDNPTPNILINRPGGPNVYKGVPIDYSGEAVNSTNFLAVLTGNEEALQNIGTGRVLKSGPKDHVFINFVDHGAPGFLCFPSDELHARVLEQTFKKMFESNLYNKMVLYVEACESGSMFESILPDDLNIFVMTAADPHESSYACYYDELRGTYLGDLFSVKWMEDAEVENLTKESIHHMFEIVRSETNTSHVEEYGNLDIGSSSVASFIGYNDGQKDKDKAPQSNPHAPIFDAVPSRDVPLEILKRKLESTSDENTKNKLRFKIHRIHKMRHQLQKTVTKIVKTASQGNETLFTKLSSSHNVLTGANIDCYESLVNLFSKKCYKISENPYALSQLPLLINMCSNPLINVVDAQNAINHVCHKQVTGVL